MMAFGCGGMNDTEMRSHFAMWAIMAAPLMAGNDLRNMSAATRTIAINQDALGLQASQVSFDRTRRVLAKRLANQRWNRIQEPDQLARWGRGLFSPGRSVPPTGLPQATRTIALTRRRCGATSSSGR